jgi:hypothetical protein
MTEAGEEEITTVLGCSTYLQVAPRKTTTFQQFLLGFFTSSRLSMEWRPKDYRGVGRGLTGMIGLSDFYGRASDRMEPEPVGPMFAVFRLEIQARSACTEGLQ